MRREPLISAIGLPCSPPPWGTLAVIDLARGEIDWQVPLGTVRDIAPLPIPWKLGVPNLGGPLVTSSGLIFVGAAMEDYLRDFDLALPLGPCLEIPVENEKERVAHEVHSLVTGPDGEHPVFLSD